MKTWQSILFGIFLGMIATGTVFIISRQPSGEPIHLAPSPSPSPITVYITGAIMRPGVYSLSTSSRVQDIVNKAGGFIEGSDPAGINLAAALADGQKIVVPFIKTDIAVVNATSPTPPKPDPTHPVYPLNINTASKEDLDLLPGVGASKAEEIVKYRDQKGQFITIEDIQNVPGIGPGIFLKIKDLISVK